jgi:hypothetical protein
VVDGGLVGLLDSGVGERVESPEGFKRFRGHVRLSETVSIGPCRIWYLVHTRLSCARSARVRRTETGIDRMAVS